VVHVTEANRSARLPVVPTMTTGSGRRKWWRKDWLVVQGVLAVLGACVTALLWGVADYVANWRGWMAEGISPVWPVLYAVIVVGLVWYTAFSAIEGWRGSARAGRRLPALCLAVPGVVAVFWYYGWMFSHPATLAVWVVAAILVAGSWPDEQPRL
jgi:hypothetical protein